MKCPYCDTIFHFPNYIAEAQVDCPVCELKHKVKVTLKLTKYDYPPDVQFTTSDYVVYFYPSNKINFGYNLNIYKRKDGQVNSIIGLHYHINDITPQNVIALANKLVKLKSFL